MNAMDKTIQALGLFPHPEGGYFRESYRSSGVINEGCLGTAFNGNRNYSTCIYFLIGSDDFSAFHRINQDEIWHFYDGSPLRLHMITEDGVHSQHVVGRDLSNNETPQFIVPGGNWFAAEVIQEEDFSLVGCTVSPGFDFEDFELILREKLIHKYPDHKEIITRLTRE